MRAGTSAQSEGASKQKYRQLCGAHRSVPLFGMDWWLDAVCGPENWDAAVLEKDGKIVGALPYFMKSHFGLRALTMPPLTQTLGPWLDYPSGQKVATRLGYEKDALGALIEALPRYDYFAQNFHYSTGNWIPFYWKGFEQTTLYSYALEDLSDRDKMWSGLQDNIRGDIRKAQKGLVVTTTRGIDTLLDVHDMTFRRQGKALPYSHDLVRRLDAACSAHVAGRVLCAEDAAGRVHAVLYLVWDPQSAYYIIGGTDPNLRGSGAASLLLWEAILFAATVTRRFDFEGSMIESIERFFRGFGGRQIPYLRVIGMSRRMRILRLVRDLADASLARGRA